MFIAAMCTVTRELTGRPSRRPRYLDAMHVATGLSLSPSCMRELLKDEVTGGVLLVIGIRGSHGV